MKKQKATNNFQQIHQRPKDFLSLCKGLADKGDFVNALT